MTLSIKIVMLAILFCIVSFSCADSIEAQDHSDSEWKSFLLSNTIDPESNSNYKGWNTQNWLNLLNQRDVLNRGLCQECHSLWENDINTIFVATEKEIIDAFSQNNHNARESEEAWSRRSFQTYTIIHESVYDCGLQYIYAEVNEDGLPTDLLGLSDSVKQQKASAINAAINCNTIEY